MLHAQHEVIFFFTKTIQMDGAVKKRVAQHAISNFAVSSLSLVQMTVKSSENDFHIGEFISRKYEC